MAYWRKIMDFFMRMLFELLAASWSSSINSYFLISIWSLPPYSPISDV